eukprot:scaffold18911_cov32-Tisochrysis_lutea.AAC.4
MTALLGRARPRRGGAALPAALGARRCRSPSAGAMHAGVGPRHLEPRHELDGVMGQKLPNC